MHKLVQMKKEHAEFPNLNSIVRLMSDLANLQQALLKDHMNKNIYSGIDISLIIVV